MQRIAAYALAVAGSLALHPARARSDPGAFDEQAARGEVGSVPSVEPACRVVAGMALGQGLRLNNPFRLERQLGDTAESLSLSAAFADGWLGATLGATGGLEHGLAVHGAIALDGIAQEVITPGYLGWWPLHPRWTLLGRIGFPIVVEPDVNVGYEIAVGGTFWATASLGLGAEFVASAFQGASTVDSTRAFVSLVALQLGVTYQFEVLP